MKQTRFTHGALYSHHPPPAAPCPGDDPAAKTTTKASSGPRSAIGKIWRSWQRQNQGGTRGNLCPNFQRTRGQFFTKRGGFGAFSRAQLGAFSPVALRLNTSEKTEIFIHVFRFLVLPRFSKSGRGNGSEGLKMGVQNHAKRSVFRHARRRHSSRTRQHTSSGKPHLLRQPADRWCPRRYCPHTLAILYAVVSKIQRYKIYTT